MTKTSRSVIASLALGIIVVPAAAAAQQQEQQKGHQQPTTPDGRAQPGRGGPEETQAREETIPMDQVPDAARKAIQNWAKDSKIDKVDKVTTKDGKTNYRAQVDKAGQKVEVLVSPDGKVLRSGEHVGGER
jgi:hypothetical protein